MRYAIVPFALLTSVLAVAPPTQAQDLLAEHRISGLKALTSVAVLIRPNTPREIASLKEWTDIVELGVHRNIPELVLSESATARAWLLLTIITTDEGAVVELSVYRWVRVLDTGVDTFSSVWSDSRVVFGGISRSSLEPLLNALLTSFAADYFRSKRESRW